MSDPYAGLDLLANAFPGTADAPLPTPHLSPVDGRVLRLTVAPTDPRWHAAQRPKITKGTPGRLSVVREGVLGGLRRSQTAARADGGES